MPDMLLEDALGVALRTIAVHRDTMKLKVVEDKKLERAYNRLADFHKELNTIKGALK